MHSFLWVPLWVNVCGSPAVQNSLLVRTPQERIKAMSAQGPDYVALLPSIELYFLLSFMFWIIAPLYTPFAVVFFIFGYVVYRNQVRTRPSQPEEAHPLRGPH